MTTEPEALAPAEREFAATLRSTLERKAAQPDPLLEAALAATRARIAAQPRTHRVRHPWWLAGGFAVAASVAMVLIGLPGGTAPARQQPTVAESVAMPDADLQFLQDMDVLVAMNHERGS